LRGAELCAPFLYFQVCFREKSFNFAKNHSKKKMETFAIRYNPRNMAVTKMLDAIVLMKGVRKIYPDNELSPEEMVQVEKSLHSGLSTMDELREILRG
jgi:hypothetical protein